MLNLLFKMMRVWLQMQHVPTSSLQNDSIAISEGVKSHVSQNISKLHPQLIQPKDNTHEELL